MHSSKGLEYRIVFVVDANEGIVPHHKAGLSADIEEERRLFYVAMTRAKDVYKRQALKIIRRFSAARLNSRRPAIIMETA